MQRKALTSRAKPRQRFPKQAELEAGKKSESIRIESRAQQIRARQVFRRRLASRIEQVVKQLGSRARAARETSIPRGTLTGWLPPKQPTRLDAWNLRLLAQGTGKSLDWLLGLEGSAEMREDRQLVTDLRRAMREHIVKSLSEELGASRAFVASALPPAEEMLSETIARYRSEIARQAERRRAWALTRRRRIQDQLSRALGLPTGSAESSRRIRAALERAEREIDEEMERMPEP